VRSPKILRTFRSVNAPEVSFAPCGPEDFEVLHEIRVAAMRESLERLGRFEPARSRERLTRSFYPQFSEYVLHRGERAGFYTARPAMDGLHLEHFYVLPAHQSQGLGTFVLNRLMARADAQNAPIFLGALKESPVNAFYTRHGFEKSGESTWDIYYVRHPRPSPAAAPPA
jgi:GNAT superfamily N-acetyltransferase